MCRHVVHLLVGVLQELCIFWLADLRLESYKIWETEFTASLKNGDVDVYSRPSKN